MISENNAGDLEKTGNFENMKYNFNGWAIAKDSEKGVIIENRANPEVLAQILAAKEDAYENLLEKTFDYRRNILDTLLETATDVKEVLIYEKKETEERIKYLNKSAGAKKEEIYQIVIRQTKRNGIKVGANFVGPQEYRKLNSKDNRNLNVEDLKMHNWDEYKISFSRMEVEKRFLDYINELIKKGPINLNSDSTPHNIEVKSAKFSAMQYAIAANALGLAGSKSKLFDFSKRHYHGNENYFYQKHNEYNEKKISELMESEQIQEDITKAIDFLQTGYLGNGDVLKAITDLTEKLRK